jgi:glutamyl-tRNA reductase
MPAESILLLGLNHKTTPIEVREKVAFTDGYDAPLTALRTIPGIKEHYLVSTCNRVEFLLVTDGRTELEEKIANYLFGGEIDRQAWQNYLYRFEGLEAVTHLFNVAASLDSMVVGETQILGQLKEAYRNASRLGTTGPLLNKLLHKSFSVAKRVRTETAIGSSAVSISYAAVQLARKIFGDLQSKKVLLIGAGEMAELAAEHLVGQGVQSVVVANRTLSRALHLAKRFGGDAVSMEELVSQLELVDIIISSTGAADIILTQEQVRPVLRQRRNRPLFFIDIAVPRDLDPGLNSLDNVFLYDIDDLNNVVEINKEQRSREASKAARIIDEETIKFDQYLQNLSVKPTIQALRQRMDEIGQQELEKTLVKLNGLSEADRRSLERMVHSINAKILHNPMVYLRNISCSGRDNSDVKVSAVRELFGLGDGTADD